MHVVADRVVRVRKPERFASGDLMIVAMVGDVHEHLDVLVGEVAGGVVGDAAEHGTDPWLTVDDGVAEPFACRRVRQDLVEQRWVGAPCDGRKGAGDLLVLNDVGPVLDDPFPPRRLLCGRCAQELRSVVEGESCPALSLLITSRQSAGAVAKIMSSAVWRSTNSPRDGTMGHAAGVRSVVASHTRV